MSKALKKSYIQVCKKEGTEPLSSVKVALNKIVDGCLNLSSVYLNTEQCQSVCHALMKYSEPFELWLTNSLIGDKGLSCLVNGFDNITKLELKGNKLFECGHELGCFLKKTKVLTHLNLEWNMIGSSESSLACLSEGIALNTSLVYLNLSNNQISHCGASFISSALTTNETLFELDLKWNNIGILGGRQLLTSLKLNNCLEELYLVGNNIPDDVLEAIGSTLSAKSRHYHDQREWNIQKEFLQSKTEFKERENDLKVSCLYDQLDEMRLSSIGITEKACDEIVLYKSEIESCYSKITFLEDQLLTAKIAFESIEERHSCLQKENEILVLEKDQTAIKMKEQLIAKDEEISFVKDQLKLLEESKADMQHKFQQKIKLISLEKESSDELIESIKVELSVVKQSKATTIKELEGQLEDISKNKSEQLQKAQLAHQLELSQNEAMWKQEKSLMNKQIQTLSVRLKELQEEHEKLSSRSKIDKMKFSQLTDEMTQDLQTKHSSEILDLNNKLADLKQNCQAVKVELSEVNAKQLAIKAERDATEEQLKHKDVVYKEAMKANDEQQIKIISMMTKHSQESEELRRQRNQFERLYEEHKQLLQKDRENNQRLKNDLENQLEETNTEKTKLCQALQDTKKQLTVLKEQEAERARHLKIALETYILGACN